VLYTPAGSRGKIVSRMNRWDSSSPGHGDRPRTRSLPASSIQTASSDLEVYEECWNRQYEDSWQGKFRRGGGMEG